MRFREAVKPFNCTALLQQQLHTRIVFQGPIFAAQKPYATWPCLALDAVADARNADAGLLHVLHELVRIQLFIACVLQSALWGSTRAMFLTRWHCQKGTCCSS